MNKFIPTPAEKNKRRGESLAEMVVVMSVIVGMASMSWPSIRNSLSKSQLQSAAKQVSSDLSKARLNAIQTGVPQEFRYQPDRNCYEIEPRTTSELKGTASELATDDAAAHPEDDSAIHRELADGLKFILAEGKSEEPRETLLASAGEWSDPIIFYPNGRASQAEFGLEGDHGMRVEIRLNGMTGTTKLGSLHKTE